MRRKKLPSRKRQALWLSGSGSRRSIKHIFST